MKDTSEKINVFREMISSVHQISFTELNSFYQLVWTNNKSFHLLEQLFPVAEGVRQIKSSNCGVLNLCTNAHGMSWIAEAVVEEGVISKIYILGPVFLDDYSENEIDKELQWLQISLLDKRKIIDNIKDLPYVSLSNFIDYGIMMHYCLSGEKVTIDDIVFASRGEVHEKASEIPEIEHVAYTVEQKILKVVEEGNLNYKDEISELVLQGAQGMVFGETYLRQAKNTVIVFTALCSRAAIKGGLAPEAAYRISDFYVREVEMAKNLALVVEAKEKMVADFVHKVHQLKLRMGISPQISKSCDYICAHLDKKVNIHDLAEMLGYTDYYFSNKFKTEVGINVRDYAAQKKIEKARDLLWNTNKSIQSIADELGFESRNYFGDVFRKITGVSPSEYRIKGFGNGLAGERGRLRDDDEQQM